MEPRCSIELDSVEAILAAIRQGLGVAYLPIAVLGRGKPGLRAVVAEGSTASTGVGILRAKGADRARRPSPRRSPSSSRKRA